MSKETNKTKKTITIIIFATIALIVGIFVWNNYNSNQHSYDNYEAEKTSTDNEKNNEENDEENPSNQPDPTPLPSIDSPPTISEEILGAFSTKIYNPDSARQNNINITCNTLNDTIVKNGETFSFCNTVGQATSAKGYQKADIFDKNGNKKKGLGGGNCQISSTLYNVVLSIPQLSVTERHKHSNYVPYIEKGKDAAVAYGSYDFKFVNQTGSDIKIVASSDGNSVSVAINKLVQN